MALTLTKVADASGAAFGGISVVPFDLTPDTSFPVGGYAITPANIGARTILGVAFIGGKSTDVGYVPLWDNVNGKFTVFVSSTGLEASGDQSSRTFRALFYYGE